MEKVSGPEQLREASFIVVGWVAFAPSVCHWKTAVSTALRQELAERRTAANDLEFEKAALVRARIGELKRQCERICGLASAVSCRKRRMLRGLPRQPPKSAGTTGLSYHGLGFTVCS